jgi:hypothetical protein
MQVLSARIKQCHNKKETVTAYGQRPATDTRSKMVLAAALTGIATFLLVYSQTMAFTWDAGFHLLAAQMINAGKRPYLDFCFPQTALNAWWMAFWMRVFGESWRVAQASAALFVAGTVVLASTFVFERFPIARWRLPAAVATAVLLAFHEQVFGYGTVAQAYGISMFLIVAAFRVTIGTPDRPGLWRPAAAGSLAGAAAGCSLLSAMAAPVLLAWMAFSSRAGSRWAKSAAFVTAAALPFLPMVRLFVEGPSQTWFNLFQYQLTYRHAGWGSTVAHDLSEMSSWLDSAPALFLFLLAAAAWWFVRSSQCYKSLRSELYLCAWLALGLTAEISLARPTFARYFVMVVPFLAILAGPGFYEAAARLRGPRAGTLLPTLLLTVLIVMGGARKIYDDREIYRWSELEEVAAKIRQVAPPHAVIYTDEPLYFLLRTDPPEGMQFAYARELDLPPAQSSQLHIVPQKTMDQRVRSGAFDVVAVCQEPKAVDRLKLKTLYRQTAQVEECDIFWNRAAAGR